MKYKTYNAPNNEQAQALRKAAIAFCEGINDPAVGDSDLPGQLRSRTLLASAVAFADSLTPEQRAELLGPPHVRTVSVR